MRKSLLAIVLMLCLATIFPRPLRAQVGQWTIIDTMQVPVSGGQAIVKDSLIYILGGYYNPFDIPGSLTDFVQIYDPVNRRFILNGAPLMLVPRAGFAAGIFNGDLFYGGGIWELSGSPALFSVERWSFSGSPELWQNDPELARRNATGLVHNNEFFIIGGQPPTGNANLTPSYLVAFNLTERRISYRLDSLFTGQELPYHQMASRVGDDIYIFGGARQGIRNEVYRFNTVNRSLTVALPMPTERAGGVAVSDEQQDIYLIGGYDESPSGGALSSTFIFSSIDATVQEGPGLVVPRRESMAVCFGGQIYVFGGVGRFNIPVLAVEVLDIGTPLSIPPDNLSRTIQLMPNYPNPFNPETIIRYSLSLVSSVKLTVYDVWGRQVRTLVKEQQSAGSYSVTWDGRSDAGLPVAAGLYLYRLQAGRHIQTRKMVLLK